MQLTLRATRRTRHGASRLVYTMSAWSVKTGRAPSRHCRDARVYGHTTSTMHDIGSVPLLIPAHPSCDSPNNTSRCFAAVDAINACLPGENSTCSVLALSDARANGNTTTAICMTWIPPPRRRRRPANLTDVVSR